MVWNVYVDDFNGKKIEVHNIFDHARFIEDCQDNYKKNKDNREEFLERLRKDIMYYYWSKCEWEVVIESWPSGRGEEKIDVYDQVMLNWGVFCDYVWEHKDEFKKKRKRA